jgi:succinylarginine dihydrolase
VSSILTALFIATDLTLLFAGSCKFKVASALTQLSQLGDETVIF